VQPGEIKRGQIDTEEEEGKEGWKRTLRRRWCVLLVAEERRPIGCVCMREGGREGEARGVPNLSLDV